jgi:hypothetical protein
MHVKWGARPRRDNCAVNSRIAAALTLSPIETPAGRSRTIFFRVLLI